MNDPENDEPLSPQVSPSAFMRQLRPEYYSDTAERSAYVLDRSVLDHHLETVTARNQTHEFEIFCRKLCERTICPSLRPQTGPDGGGDSKADSETLPVAKEVASLTYVGLANDGKEKWAFAFSAMKDWRKKAKSDVKGIVETDRGYKRIFFVTSRYAKSKTRADLEQELTKEYGVEVTILDRSWILEEVIDKERKDLAFNYLHVGQEIADTFRLGPSDYSRSRQLEDREGIIRSGTVRGNGNSARHRSAACRYFISKHRTTTPRNRRTLPPCDPACRCRWNAPAAVGNTV